MQGNINHSLGFIFVNIRDQMHVVGKVRFFHTPKVTDVLLVLLYRKAGGKESPSPWVQPMGTEEEGKP